MRLLRAAGRIVFACVAGYLLTAAVFLNGCSSGPLRVDPLQDAALPPVTDAQLELAREYAPWIFHQVHPDGGRQDLPAPVDFDGDLDGENNWEHFAHYELPPTVYYAVLETETHWFLAYHLFHPRDWTPFDLGLHLSHENDGENLQVVVEKATGLPVLLFTQAHFRGQAWSNGAVGPGSQPLAGGFRTVGEDGRPDAVGKRVAVFVESHGHGIYSTDGPDSGVTLQADGDARFEGAGMLFRPAQAGEVVAEPEVGAAGSVPYRLESLTAKLWPLLDRGELVGEGRLLDGAVPYEDARVRIGVPRYYEADRWSGPFGADRGMSPFALDFGWSPPQLGALFFDPARRYAETLAVPEPWSLEYRGYPFVRQGTK